jgi:hypothetical protein
VSSCQLFHGRCRDAHEYTLSCVQCKSVIELII